MSNIEKLAAGIPQGADPFKVAKYLALRGERILPFDLSEFGQIVPGLIRQDRSAWLGATSDLEIIERLEPRFRRKGTLAGVALGTPRQPFFMYWDDKSFQQIGSSEPAKPKPVSFSEFVPAHSAEQKGEAYSRLLDHSQQLHKLEDQKRALIQRVASLQAERQVYDRLQADRDELESRISTAEAEALISGESVDLKDDLEKSSVLSKEVRKTKRLADANRIATTMLQRDIAKLDSLIESQREAVNRAKEKWLDIKRAVTCDELRKNLHNLGPIVADLLAVERIGSFRVDYGWEFVKAVANPTIQHSGIKPDWADIWTNERFPGFQEALEALRAELNGGA